MGFTWLALLLVWLLCFANTDLGKEPVSWNNPLTYVLLVALALALLSSFIGLWKMFRSQRPSEKKHEDTKCSHDVSQELLTKDFSIPSNEYGQISRDLTCKQKLLAMDHQQILANQTRMSLEISEIRTALISIDKQLAVEKARREVMAHSMTTEKLNVQNQINALQALCEQFPSLQYEKQQLTVRCIELEQKNAQLEQKYESLQTEYNYLKQVNSELRQEQEQTESPEQRMN